MTKKDEFNWKGIKDNRDGTFEAMDKRNKNRLIKEFRKQGVRARSTRIGPSTYYVYPVGKTKTRTLRPRYPSYKPRTRVKMGARPQLREQPSFFAAPPRRASQYPMRQYRGRNANLAGMVGGAIQKWSAGRAAKNREEQRSPYTPEGKPREGYKTYQDRTGTQRIIREKPSGLRERFFPTNERKEALHQARVQESIKIEKDMASRSRGSTRIQSAPSPKTTNISPPRNVSYPHLTTASGRSYPPLADETPEPSQPKQKPEKTMNNQELNAARVNAIENR